MNPTDERPTIMGLLSERARMTEGQLYTVVIAALAVLLLTFAGLPGAHRTSHDPAAPPPPVASAPAAP